MAFDIEMIKKVYSNIVINVDNVDFVSNPEDYNELVTHIKRDVVGKEYINLSQTIF